MKNLPDADAPASLIPRVLAAVRAEQALTAAVANALLPLRKDSAPAGLIPRVSEAIRQREVSPFWRRPWATWAFPLQTASIVMFAASAWWSYLLLASALHSGAVAQLTEWATPLTNAGGRGIEALASLAKTVALIVASVPVYYIAIAISIYLLMLFGCVGLATACVRLAWSTPRTRAGRI